MNCQHRCGVERTFNSRLAEHELQDYRAHGPGKSTRLLIEAVVCANGLERRYECKTPLWQVMLYAR
jgi:hypothetical protein